MPSNLQYNCQVWHEFEVWLFRNNKSLTAYHLSCLDMQKIKMVQLLFRFHFFYSRATKQPYACKMTSPTKWKCDYCTFLNWPSSQKCTMCRAFRPLRLISPTSSKLDIAIESKTCSTQDSADRGDDNKWSCAACTYLNWPRSLR